MSEEFANSGSLQLKHKTLLYPPSWIDRFSAWVEQLAGPCWLYYIGIGLLLLLILSIALWVEGAFPTGTVLPVQLFLSGVFAYFLAMFYYLDEWAGSALATLRPDLTVDDNEYNDLQFQITTLPARPTVLASLTALALALITEAISEPYHVEALNTFPISTTLLRIIYFGCWWLFGTFLYHTIHQLRLINHVYTHHTDINLFRMRPFYAFSNLSAFTAGSLAMIIYGFLVVNPAWDRSDPVILFWIFVFLISALVTFVWPQLGMHHLQVAEQDRLVDEAYMRLEATIAELHRQLDNGEFREMEAMNYAIASLEIELNTLKRIRTWPWEPETLQLLITALALPLGLWILQLIFERMLGS